MGGHHHHHGPKHFEAGPGRLAPDEALKSSGFATKFSVTIAAILVISKLIVWLMSDSVAILASLFDSGLDLAASMTAFVAVRLAARPADREHRFGHGKSEAFSSLLQSILVAVSSVFLFYEGVKRLMTPQPIEAGGWAMGVMFGSMVLTGLLVFVQTREIRKTGSIAVQGDRAHYIADFLTNFVVAVGVGLAYFAGWARIDAILAVLAAFWLLHSAYFILRGSLDQLLDRELPDIERKKIKAVVLEDKNILAISQLRTRCSGPLIHMQFHIDVAADLSLIDAHEILVACEKRLHAAYPAADVFIHLDPHGHDECHGSSFFGTKKGV